MPGSKVRAAVWIAGGFRWHPLGGHWDTGLARADCHICRVRWIYEPVYGTGVGTAQVEWLVALRVLREGRRNVRFRPDLAHRDNHLSGCSSTLLVASA